MVTPAPPDLHVVEHLDYVAAPRVRHGRAEPAAAVAVAIPERLHNVVHPLDWHAVLGAALALAATLAAAVAAAAVARTRAHHPPVRAAAGGGSRVPHAVAAGGGGVEGEELVAVVVVDGEQHEPAPAQQHATREP